MTAQEAVITEQVKNKKTKDRITETALRLFAANGFSGTSMQDIAAELGITKAALYKHFSGKQEIFDSIICRMQEKDYENAHSCGVPEGTIEEMSDSYASVSPESIIAFSKEMFRYWTEEEFPSLFRKMLTLEQYSSAEMRELYCQYISSGPLEYVRDMFFSVYSDADSAKAAALEYYGPLFLLYSIYDTSEDKPAVTAAADRHIDSFFDRNRKVKELNGNRKNYKVRDMTNMTNNMNSDNIIIRHETEDEHRAVETLVRESFWNVYRPGCLEHFVLNQLRNDPDFVKELDYVMYKDGRLIGQNIFMKAVIKSDDGRDIPIMAMGPICIANDLKRKGYGKLLLDYTLERAAELGCGAVCFEGNIDFYGKSGFSEASNYGIRYHGLPEDADASFFLCKELIPGYLNGITGEYAPPSGYFVDEQKAEEFDRQFPPMEKLVLPGQLF